MSEDRPGSGPPPESSIPSTEPAAPAMPVPPPPPLMPSATGPAPKHRRQKPRRAKLLALGVAVALASAGALTVIVRAAKPKGPPSAPGGVVVKGAICTPPDCHALSGTVTVSWSAPVSGSAATGYDVYRDGVKITGHTLAATATTYKDNDTALGSSLTYSVLAHSDQGDSPRSPEMTAKFPEPPDRFAQLSGIFRVRLTVQRASNLATVEGIKQPVPGDTAMQTWSVQPSCPTNTGPCSVKMLTFDSIVMRANRHAYDGSGHGVLAGCFSGGKTSTTYSFHLVPSAPRMKGPNWVYTSFTGTEQLSFTCPNSVTSSATFALSGRNTQAIAPDTSGA